ncbi:MAG: transposase zinc-binding domain-containing protein, partial [Deltaproteobacteria bacterium]|nr:transposase zinc-binding domain-containing protein [Deltaproteobacteria bacterium]
MRAEQSKMADKQYVAGNRPKWELAYIFRTYGNAYLALHPTPSIDKQVMQDIMLCRTAYLGGHIQQCDTCGAQQIAYNSCRNRHCPKCQALAKAKWLEARKAELLPVTYFHGVFTVPHEINAVALCNKALIFNMLFKAASETLLAFGKNPQNRLGGQLGFTAILHTWDQLLKSHLHLHCIIPAGALSSDGTQWVPVKGDYLFCTLAISKVFRSKFMALFKKAFEKGKLKFCGKAKVYAAKGDFKRLSDTLCGKDWVVYARPPFGGPKQVLDYLGRYTH